jgi:membrane-associated phospholipid phosphatase
MPSLHTAWALMAVAFFLPMVSRRWWPLLLAYPLAMTFTLVYTGEHYVIDVLVGWAYVAMVFVVVGLAERWWQARRAVNDPGRMR